MANDEKKYYYIKLEENYFDIKIQKALRKLPGGAELLICYLKIQLKYAKVNGIIKYDGIYPTIFEEIAIDIDEDPEIVEMTINCLSRWHALEINEDEIYLSEMQNRIGTKSDVALRVAKHRDNKKKNKMLQCNTDVTKSNAISELEIKIEDRKIDINNNILCSQIENLKLIQVQTNKYDLVFKSKQVYLDNIGAIPDYIYSQFKLYQNVIVEIVESKQSELFEKVNLKLLEKVYGQVIKIENIENIVNYFRSALSNEIIKRSE